MKYKEQTSQLIQVFIFRSCAGISVLYKFHNAKVVLFVPLNLIQLLEKVATFTRTGFGIQHIEL
jgi:hypothetical protein